MTVSPPLHQVQAIHPHGLQPSMFTPVKACAHTAVRSLMHMASGCECIRSCAMAADAQGGGGVGGE